MPLAKAFIDIIYLKAQITRKSEVKKRIKLQVIATLKDLGVRNLLHLKVNYKQGTI